MSGTSLQPTADRLEWFAHDALRRCGPDGPDGPAGPGGPGEYRLTLLCVSENATFAVDSPGQPRSVLRVHRPGYHSRTAIESELAWISALRAEQVVSTPEVLPGPDGSPVVVATHPDGEQRHVVRFTWVPGTEPAGDRLVGDFQVLGAIAARLHDHARRWQAPPWFTRLRWDVETSLGERGHWGRWQDGQGVGPAQRRLFERVVRVVRRRLAAFGAGPQRFGLVHADMRLANLLVAGPQVHVIDFDDSGYSWFLYDLAASLSFIEHEPQVPELIDAWLTGYRQVAPLSAQEEAEIPTFVLMRRLLLVAWIGSHHETEQARAMGPQYTADSCRLAEEYLSRFG